MKKIAQSVFLLYVLFSLSGCIAATVVSAAVDVTTTVVGGAIDVVDAVTPDIIDDDDEQAEDDDEQAEGDDHDNGEN
ncbi:MAG: hypothetical protein HRT53_14935 [Colwellia sp.]|nr:hypothetical protein [Colwellia sp.]